MVDNVCIIHSKLWDIIKYTLSMNAHSFVAYNERCGKSVIRDDYLWLNNWELF